MAKMSTQLAMNGGRPVVPPARPAPLRWGAPERRQLLAMLKQPSLFYWRGPQTNLLIKRFQQHYPLRWVMPCSSGTAAIHIALIAAGIGPGDEVITSPITDMGTTTGILYQQGVVVFADLDPRRYTLDPADVRRKITRRTKAIVAVHLAGIPCDLGPLKKIAAAHNLVLIEDCAQSWGARWRGRPVGTVGHIGCFSVNDFKHIGCGDGGIVGSSDKRFGPLLQRAGDKCYDRVGGSRAPTFLAPNYRMTEPQAAVAAGQFTRFRRITEGRARLGRLLTGLIADAPGILPPLAGPRDVCTCWFYYFRLDLARLTCDRNTFAQALAAERAPAHPGYLTAPIYTWPVFQDRNFFAGRWPIQELGLTKMDYRKVKCPNAETLLGDGIMIPIREWWTPAYVRAIAKAVRKVAAHYARR